MRHNTEWLDSLDNLSADEFNKTTLFYILVLPNISLFYGVFEYLGHTWSIGVEEQFYLIWPLLMKWFKNKTTLLLFGVIGIVWVSRFVTAELEWATAHTFLSIFRIDSMAIGGLSAIVLLEYPAIKKYLVNTWSELFALCAVFIFYLTETDFGNVSDEIYSLFFSIIIVNAACNPNTLIRLEKIKPLGYFGQLSYGIYMYHPITGMLSLLIFNAIHPSYMASLSSNLAFYALVFALSLGVAALSYELVEKRIMNWGRNKWLKTT